MSRLASLRAWVLLCFHGERSWQMAQSLMRTPLCVRQSQTLLPTGTGSPRSQFCHPALSVFLGCQKQEPDPDFDFLCCSGALLLHKPRAPKARDIFLGLSYSVSAQRTSTNTQVTAEDQPSLQENQRYKGCSLQAHEVPTPPLVLGVRHTEAFINLSFGIVPLIVLNPQ